jgi:hypothetical protein
MSRAYGIHAKEEECVWGLLGKTKGAIRRPRGRRDVNIKMNLRVVGWGGLD